MIQVLIRSDYDCSLQGVMHPTNIRRSKLKAKPVEHISLCGKIDSLNHQTVGVD